MMSSPYRKSGFSLIELMIAIMILGLGMVMAATVFPVSLDMTRGTVQLNISETAADVAAGTLAIRVPRAKNLEKSNSDTLKEAVALPNVAGIDLDDFELTAADLAIMGEPGYSTLVPPDYLFYAFLAQPTAPLNPTNGAPMASFLTELSFWESQYVPTNIGLALPTFIVRSQTMPATSAAKIADDELAPIIPEVLATGTIPTSVAKARISLADRVYPPVDLYVPDPNTGQPVLKNSNVLRAEIRERRYAWTAIHFRDLEDQTQRTFFARIVILYRGNTSARYPAQVQPADRAAARLPTVQGPGFDALFPQPWLVSLDSVNADGIVTCTADVARLLPVGSYFILAQGNSGTLPGAYTKVTQNTWDNVSVGDIATTLRIAPKSFPAGGPWYVWVFPPALRGRTGIGDFDNTSPTVDVVPKKIVAG